MSFGIRINREFDFSFALSQAKYYRNQIARIHLKHGSNLFSVKYSQGGLSISNIAFNADNFASVLAKTVSAGKYEFEPGEIRTAEINGKERVLYSFRLTDLILHGVVAQIMDEAMEPLLSDNLFSYRSGISRWEALHSIADYVRKHKKSFADPKRRGLYVIRRDVTKYTDNIPLGNNSPLWPKLSKLLCADRQFKKEHLDILENVIRPEIHEADGCLFSNIKGIPTGSPVSNSLFNFYLLDLDNQLNNIPGGFYARYSDDFLFMHPDPQVVIEANQIISKVLNSLLLTTNPLKDRLIFLNGAGRKSEFLPELPGAQSITFLGCRISFDGTVSLAPHKVKELLDSFKDRIHRTTEIYETENIEELGATVCQVLNNAIETDQPLTYHNAEYLLKAINDRAQLKDLDYRLALMIAERLSGVRGVRAFREVPYNKIRAKWRLISFFHSRNE